MKEILKVFNENYEMVGTDSRENIHAKGYWHETFHCWFVRSDPKGEGQLLFQLRSPNKSLFPNCLDITAAGHLLANEEKEDGIREIKEELGVDIEYSDLHYAGIRPDMAKIGNIINREFCHTFFIETSVPLEEFNFSEDEVYGLVEIPIDQGVKLFTEKIEQVSCNAVTRNPQGVIVTETKMVKVSDLIPRVDRYYLKAFMNAQKVIDGSTFLAI